MTAPVRNTQVVLPPTASTAGSTTKAAPSITGAWIDIRSSNGGQLGISVKNGSAPGVAGQFAVQIASDTSGADIYDLGNAGGNTALNGEVSFLWGVPAEASYVRVICWGNTVNDVTFKSHFFGKA